MALAFRVSESGSGDFTLVVSFWVLRSGCFVLACGHPAAFERRILEQISTRVTADSSSKDGVALLTCRGRRSLVRLIFFLLARSFGFYWF